MSVEIRHMQAFLTVATELHFGRAAQKLNVAQPALSRTIQHLESILGVQLLERTTRNVQLTDAGRTFRDQSAKLLHQLDLAVQMTRGTPTGETGSLSVGYIDVLLGGPVLEILYRFQRKYPDVKVEFLPRAPDSLLQLVTEKQIDCGIALGPINDNSLDTQCIFVEPAVALLPAPHRLAFRSKVRLAELADEVFALPPRFGWGDFHQRFERLCLAEGFRPQIGQEAHESSALLAMVTAELGISVCPESMTTNLRGGVIAKPISDCPLFFESHFVWRKDNISPLVANFASVVELFEVQTNRRSTGPQSAAAKSLYLAQ